MQNVGSYFPFLLTLRVTPHSAIIGGSWDLGIEVGLAAKSYRKPSCLVGFFKVALSRELLSIAGLLLSSLLLLWLLWLWWVIPISGLLLMLLLLRQSLSYHCFHDR